MAEDFAFAPWLRMRLLGVGVLTLAVIVVAITLVGTLLEVPTLVSIVLLAACALGLIVLGTCLVPRRHVIRLDEAGYRVRWIRGTGEREARWSDVQNLQTAEVAGSRCVQMQLRNGSQTTIPVDAIEGDSEELVRKLRDHLDRRTRG